MRELYSKALVLERRNTGEVDGIISLFTEDFGKIVAFAKSIRKPTSKLSAHLQPLTFIKVRFIQRQGPRDGWAIVDCLYEDDFSGLDVTKRFDMLPIVGFLNSSLFEFQTDRKLWAYIKHIFSRHYEYADVVKGLLAIMGFDPAEASCLSCHSREVSVFHTTDQVFLCSSCASKFPADKLLLINK
jgi:recombinational DNA repair protein (RecF pathway)